MSDGPLFPKKTDPGGQEESPPVVIERTDEPSSGGTTGRRRPTLPTMQGKQVGCGSSVFVLMLVIAVVAVGGVIL